MPYATGKRALAICDVCGFRCKYRELRPVIVNRVKTGTLACRKCWDPDHPQLQVGEIRVKDFEALRNPRPDTAEHGSSRAVIIPLKGIESTFFQRQFTVVES